MPNPITNVIQTLKLGKYKYTVGSIIQDIHITNSDILRYVKDWSGEKENYQYGFKLTIDTSKKSKLRRHINSLVLEEVPDYHFDASVITRIIIHELIEQKVEPIQAYQRLFGSVNGGPLLQFLAPMSQVKKLRQIIPIVDDFLTQMPTLVANEFIRIEQEKRLKREERSTYEVDSNIPTNFMEQMKNNNIYYLTNQLYPLRKNKICFHTIQSSKDIPIGTSKIGGRPHLPNESFWPEENGKKLGFLLQVNFSEAKPFDMDNLLPEEGLLSVFYDNEKMLWESDGEGFKILYIKDKQLQRINTFENLEDINKFSEVSVKLSSKPSFPVSADLDFIDDQEMDNYFGFVEGKEGKETYLLGYPIEIQSDVIEENKYIFPDITDNASDWILLLQIDSIEEANMMWGDAGRLYFLIHKEDLSKQDFSKVRVLLQCF